VPARRRSRSGRTGWLVVLLCAVAVETTAAVPRVRLIATGGTIANHPQGRLSAAALIASVAGLDAIARVDAETFSTMPSLGLSLADWLRLARRLRQVAQDGDTAGIVVTGGTDTLEELAWFLDLVVRTDHPIVVTGAMRRPGDPDADGPANVADAVRVAADPSARGRGTLVVMQGDVLAAREAMKTSTLALEAFVSTGPGPIGRVDSGRIRFRRDVTTRHAQTSEFDVVSLTRLPRVDVLPTYQDAPGDAIRAAIEAGARGLVIASAGAGSLSASQASALQVARRAHVPVVVASRVPAGRVDPDDVPESAALVIAGGTLTPVKARILLMLALATSLDAPGIARVFREY
jgi:L-asparaginase